MEQLEQLDALSRAAPQQGGGFLLSVQAITELGWSEGEARTVLRALGFTTTARARNGEPAVWRRRRQSGGGRRALGTSPVSPTSASVAVGCGGSTADTSALVYGCKGDV